MRLAPLSFLLAIALLTGCDGGPGSSLYDPDRPSLADPVISNVTTDDPIVLAGIDVITIEGQNFSTVPSENLVYFENGNGDFARGEVIEASATRLRVKTPNFPGATLNLRISVVGAENYSSPMVFGLTAAVEVFGAVVTSEAEEVVALTRDNDGNLIAALQRNGDAQGIFAFDETSGERTRVAEAARPWVDLTYNTDGTLIGVLSNRAIYSIPATGVGSVFAAAAAAEQPPAFTVVANASGDAVWAAGAEPAPGTGEPAPQTRFYKFAADRSYTVSTPQVGGAAFTGVVRDMIVRDGALYVASQSTSTSRVVRFPIDASGDLGAGEVVYTPPTGSVTSIAFAADGTMYVGTTNRTNPIYEVTAGGVGSPLYPGVITGPVRALAWDGSTGLYYSTPVVPGATPEAAPTPAQLYKLETRRQGAP
ncbi:IPT/TIG domain-containing protein [Rubricoccus marinus]|uniref:IPT/TIG domain-containing protein n=1 Tax=Rubricoccus marinus TaxID=716817 RepID=A0A259U0Z0_9BACT|nr:IPT/TIG domain-containing protein [Rubricoccus marinus]OZC03508.1 hypothetical protein BSZ36_11255 [Rubricoccus marinus]